MRIIKLIICLCIAGCINMFGQTECSEIQLVKCFEASKNSADSLAKVNFFRSFQNHFEYITEFGNSLKYVSIQEWVAKLIGLTQEGEWGPDAVFMLQAVMIEQFRKEGKRFSYEMHKYNYQQLFNFFYFYLNDINPNYTSLPVELNVLSEREKEIAVKALKDVINHE